MSSLVRTSLSRRFATRPRSSFFTSSSSSSSSASAIITKNLTVEPTSSVFRCFYSSSSAAGNKIGANAKLAQVIQSKISNQGGLVPDGFPFEIIDNPGEQTLVLKRQFSSASDETIQVDVNNLDGPDDYHEICFLVTISKQQGPLLQLHCIGSPYNDIEIKTLHLKEDSPYSSSNLDACDRQLFSEWEEDLQKAFYEFLDMRGINTSLMSFLQNYMRSNYKRDKVTWLKILKAFVEK